MASEANGTAQPVQQGSTPAEPIDPLKKAKKDEKAAIKAAKKEKMLAKQAKQQAEQQQRKDAPASKSKKAVAEEAKAKEAAEVESMIKSASATASGTKKACASLEDMPKSYHPRFVEAAWYSWWEQSGYFQPHDNSDAENFVIVLPPPNVTGSLHLGHALTDAIQDALARWHRMSGRNTLWVPGLDHASIATQSIVEKTLLKKGIKREELGRDKFLAEVHKWVDEYGGKICNQMRRLGTSCDWTRQAYTMNEQLSRAVKEAFLRMHKDGLIYRDVRLVNWDSTLRTAVSDSEVDYQDIPPFSKVKVPGYSSPVEFGVLTSFAYPLEDPYTGPDGAEVKEIVVATTRPETMIGDTGIAVHPEDPRYTSAIGKFALHPLDKRKIPIVADDILVDMNFGTGAVKITPAHDPNDFEVGKRHDLEFINVLTDDGSLNARGKQFEGLPRFTARVEIVKWLEAEGLFRGTEGNAMRLGTCSRSSDVIEPVIKPQWWVNCKEIGEKAAQAVHNGDLRILPTPKHYLDWIARMRDWCISRQLWWGHRIPAFYYTLEGENEAKPGSPSERTDHWVAAEDQNAAEQQIAKIHPGKKIISIEQDVDVLDTWFSSGLFPFSVMGWPEQTADLEKFYPTSLLETGNDIIFFWVLRMVMMGIQLTGKVPFHTVYLHNMVRDAHGRKMSKSLGNVIDPLEVTEGITLERLIAKLHEGNLAASEIDKATKGLKTDFPDGIEECGTDALRLTLLQYQAQGRDLNLDIKRIVANRHWCNKLWNAIRFGLLNLGDKFEPEVGFPQEASSLPLACRWILSRTAAAISSTIESYESYSFGEGVQALYSWWQYELCDVFVELVKPVIQSNSTDEQSDSDKAAFRNTLCLCLDTGLRLIHPVMPFVTEELWQRLPKPSGLHADSIMLAQFPQRQESWQDKGVESAMEFLLEVVKATRGLRSDFGLLKERPKLFVQTKEAEQQRWLEAHSGVVAVLASVESAEALSLEDCREKKGATAVISESTTLLMEMTDLMLDKEIKRLQDKKGALIQQQQNLQKRLGAADYSKTPEHIQAGDREKGSRFDQELHSIELALQKMTV